MIGAGNDLLSETFNPVSKRPMRRALCVSLAPLTLTLLMASACSSNKPEEPTVSVQVVPVKKATIEQTVKSEAILFPLAQSAIVPKISAPVKAFYVKRGDKVHAGQLLAKLESRDLAAAAQDNEGSYDQAQAAYAIATASTLPEEIQKAQGDTKAAKEAFEAEQKLYDSRQDLYKQGALPRKDLDQAGVTLTQARNQYELAQRHLDALMAVAKAQALKAAGLQVGEGDAPAATGQGAAGAATTAKPAKGKPGAPPAAARP